jgi:hypothetical protein
VAAVQHGVEWFDKAISPLLRSDFAQSTAGHPPNGDLTDSIVPSDGRAAPQSGGETPATGDRRSGRFAHMQTKPMIDPAGSPVPGVIPEPVRVHHDPAAGHERPPATARTRCWRLPPPPWRHASRRSRYE